MRRREDEGIDSGRSLPTLNDIQLLSSRNETLGGRFRLPYISHEVWRIVAPILKEALKISNPDIAKEVMELVSIINDLLLKLNNLNYDISNLQPFFASNLDDGSFLIEWLLPNNRIGIMVGPNSKESVWYAIARGESSDSNSTGLLESGEKKTLLSKLIFYVAGNS